MFSLTNLRRRSFVFGALFILANSIPIMASAQEYVGANSLHGKTVIMPRGTTWEGRLNITIGSKSRQGQPFVIGMSAPVLANGTDVLIPAGSQILGEVVEAIPGGDVPHPKGMKPTGKLRVQLTTLRTPDGITYPLVASLTGELNSQPGRGGQPIKGLGGGIGYVGSDPSFAAVAPGAANRNRFGSHGRGPEVLSKRDIMRDPIYGVDDQDQNAGQTPKIRSLVKRGRDLFIDAGSPVTVKLDAPFKIGISQAAGAAAALTPQVEVNTDGTFGRRFQKQAAAPAQLQDPSNPNAPGGAPGENPLPGILPDTPHAYVPVTLPPGAAAPANGGAPAVQAAPAQQMQGQPGMAPAQGQAATPAKGDF